MCAPGKLIEMKDSVTYAKTKLKIKTFLTDLRKKLRMVCSRWPNYINAAFCSRSMKLSTIVTKKNKNKLIPLTTSLVPLISGN